MTQYPAVFELSDLDGANGFKIFGSAPIEGSGVSVASAGDVNGDGIPDLMIGASATSYVVFGTTSGFGAVLNLSSLDGANGFQIDQAVGNGGVGRSVASAGDVNGDGFADMIVSDAQAGFNGYWSGSAYVVFGKASGFDPALDLSSIDGVNGFRMDGEAPNNFFGCSVASAGDVNGDGFDDVIVGAMRSSANGFYSGASYVVFGKASGFDPALAMSSLDGGNGFRIVGQPYDETGISVASAGDVNGDGIADLIVGGIGASSQAGAAFVVFGTGAGFGATLDLSSLDGHNGFEIAGHLFGAQSGFTVASAGDLNGDGFADLIVGAPYADANGVQSGAAYVVFGAASGFGATVNVSDLDGTNGFEIAGGTAGDQFGFTVAAAGDFNGDGFGDLIISARKADAGGAQPGPYGAYYVVFGKASGFGATLDLSSLDGDNGFKIDGEHADDGHGGVSAAAAGDVNGDGFADLIIGAQYADAGGNESGESYVIFGAAPAEAVTRVGTDSANLIQGGSFGDTLEGLGGADDLVGNSGNDVLVGGAGDDTLNGGAGSDTASYADATGGVTVALGGATPAGSGAMNGPVREFVGGGEGADTFISIENLEGSNYDDHLTGNAGDNVLTGNAGDDTLSGGKGSDTASYANASSGVTVDLAIKGAQAVGGGQGSDKLISIENLTGSDYDDVLTGDKHSNTLGGGAGDDTLDGKAGSDTASYADASAGVTVDLSMAGPQVIGGGEGSDTLVSIENIIGSAYDDLLSGNAGDNALNGGAGSDSVSYAKATGGVTVDLAIKHGQAVGGGQGSDTLVSIENLRGSAYGDSLTGNAKDNRLEGGAGADTINGGGGSDTASYAHATGGVRVDLSIVGAQVVGGGEGSDTLISVENLEGSSHDDSLTGNSGKNVLAGGAGDDTLNGAGGSDTADYSDASGGVTVDLSLAGPQAIGGGQGSDTLVSIENVIGTASDDRFSGNTKDNVFNAGAGGDDVASGAGGDDTFVFGAAFTAADRIDGGTGADTLDLDGDYSSGLLLGAATLVNVETISLAAGHVYDLTTDDATVAAGQTMTVDASALGSGNSLTFTGTAETNGVFAVVGGAGHDTIMGGAGGDTLRGGAGGDSLTGGLGNDLFLFTALTDSTTDAPDLITDFASGDRIDLHLIDAKASITGDQPFHLGATPGHEGDLVVSYDSLSHRTAIDLYVNGDATADGRIWLSGDHSGLTAADFVL